MQIPPRFISVNGSKAAGKSTLALELVRIFDGMCFEFFGERYHYQKSFLPQLSSDSLNKWQTWTAVPFFGLGWHLNSKTINRIIEKGDLIVFDHYYFDYLVQIHGTLRYLETLEKIITCYELPSLDTGLHFWLDIDYATYLARRQERIEQHPGLVRDKIIVKEKRFEKRRELYKKLVKQGYLIQIHANKDKIAVCDDAKRYIQDKWKDL